MKKGVDKRYRYSDRIGVQDRGEGNNRARGLNLFAWNGKAEKRRRIGANSEGFLLSLPPSSPTSLMLFSLAAHFS